MLFDFNSFQNEGFEALELFPRSCGGRSLAWSIPTHSFQATLAKKSREACAASSEVSSADLRRMSFRHFHA